MTDYVITGGVSSSYPKDHYGAHFVGGRATFCLDADFAALDANVLAIPNFRASVVTPSPVVVTDAFFGMSVMQRYNDSLSGVTASVVRSHDMANGKGRWSKIQTTSSTVSSTWDWTDVDSWVNTHYAAGRDLIFTLFATPTWASARPTEEGVYGSSNLGIQAEPADLANWDFYCTAVATRYLGKIKYYEVWNEPNMNNNGTTASGTQFFFSGTFSKLSEMVRRANQAIKAVDPTAKILSPAVQGWAATSGASDTYFTGMMSASDGAAGTMKDWVDIIAVHLYLPAGNKAQDLAAIIDRVNASKVTAGVSGLETWDTESAPIGPDALTMLDVAAQAVVGRMMIIMAAKGITRTIYYQLDHGTMGLRPSVIAFRESIITLLKSGTILNVHKFTDGRVAYYTSSGLNVI